MYMYSVKRSEVTRNHAQFSLYQAICARSWTKTTFINLLGFIYTIRYSNILQICNFVIKIVYIIGCQIQATSTLTMFDIQDKIV